MLRIQRERQRLEYFPSVREYARLFGITRDRVALMPEGGLIMHPGPMNRGVEIDSEVADDLDRSLIRHQVEMGVAVRMACLEALTRELGNGPSVK